MWRKFIWLYWRREKFEHGIKGKVLKSYGQERKIHLKILLLNRDGKIISLKERKYQFWNIVSCFRMEGIKYDIL